MTPYDGIEVSPSEIIGKGIVLLRVNNSFDYEEQKFVKLVVKCLHFITLIKQVQLCTARVVTSVPIFISRVIGNKLTKFKRKDLIWLTDDILTSTWIKNIH